MDQSGNLVWRPRARALSLSSSRLFDAEEDPRRPAPAVSPRSWTRGRPPSLRGCGTSPTSLLSRRGAVEPALAFILSSTARDRDLAHACTSMAAAMANAPGWKAGTFRNKPEVATGHFRRRTPGARTPRTPWCGHCCRSSSPKAASAICTDTQRFACNRRYMLVTASTFEAGLPNTLPFLS